MNYDADCVAHHRPQVCTYGATHPSIRKMPGHLDATVSPRCHPSSTTRHEKTPGNRLGFSFHTKVAFKESVTTAELEREAGPDVVDRHLVSEVGRIGRSVSEGDRAQIGVAVLHAAQQIIGERIFDAGAGRPTLLAAGAVGE